MTKLSGRPSKPHGDCVYQHRSESVRQKAGMGHTPLNLRYPLMPAKPVFALDITDLGKSKLHEDSARLLWAVTSVIAGMRTKSRGHANTDIWTGGVGNALVAYTGFAAFAI
jgi:hypothetical protein